ncbi:uncharacterized protein M6B38_365340 [Iris pallida]|uniref:Uncharacterized protein n=1 Tax=Iris pallida TaxID=29817 RepID=A0AAX6FGF3_IRIPA|nr:uncharacterized protein M6B38_133240 [Iris pallida]KAJ6827853.1 uncharacterized protein M6B38_365340 [Iris pallida]
MDPSSLNQSSSPPVEEDDWDTDGFVIPSLSVEETDLGNQDAPMLNTVDPPPKEVKEEKIYLGPHGAPPSQAKQQQDLTSSGRKQRLKQKLKEADRKHSGSVGRENKLENLKELVGGKVSSTATNAMMPKASPRDWLDPHCHESQFEKYSN